MKKWNDARYKAAKRIQKFNADNATVLNAITEYGAEKTDFDNKVSLIESAMEEQAIETNPITVDKKLKKDIMINAVYKYALRAAVKAHQVGAVELESAFDKPKSYLTKVGDDLCETRCREGKDLIKTNLAILSNITSANVTEMETAITNFSNIKSSPKEVSEVRKTQGTEKIAQLLEEIEIPKLNMGRLIHSYLPDLASEWDAINTIGDAQGMHHVSLILHYADLATDVPLKGVKATITDGITTVIKKSSLLGRIEVKSMENGNWTITSERDTYTTDVQNNVGIQKGDIKEITIKLTKV